MSGIGAVAMRFERRSRRIEHFRWPAQIARDESDLGLGDDATRPRHRLFRAEAACRAPQQCLRAIELAKLRHGDAAQREGRWIVAQSNAVEGAERITLGEGTPCCRDQRVHRNPDTLVTPLIALSGPKSISRSWTKGEKAMTKHPAGTRQEWLAARLDLLRAEKELTHRSDAIARQRQALPWVRIDKDYVFDTDGGKQSLRDLFAGRSQL